jgi:hypothetical protein
MHLATQLLVFWAIAFLTLCTALVLLNVYCGIIGDDFEPSGFGKEAAIAGTASFIEGASVWLVISFVPGAGRALVIPVLIVIFIYKLTHLENCSYGDAVLLLAFQIAISFVGGYLLLGDFNMAIIILGGFVTVLAVFAFFAKSLGD